MWLLFFLIFLLVCWHSRADGTMYSHTYKGCFRLNKMFYPVGQIKVAVGGETGGKKSLTCGVQTDVPANAKHSSFSFFFLGLTCLWKYLFCATILFWRPVRVAPVVHQFVCLCVPELSHCQCHQLMTPFSRALWTNPSDCGTFDLPIARCVMWWSIGSITLLGWVITQFRLCGSPCTLTSGQGCKTMVPSVESN